MEKRRRFIKLFKIRFIIFLEIKIIIIIIIISKIKIIKLGVIY
jgi:hypothetical protein